MRLTLPLPLIYFFIFICFTEGRLARCLVNLHFPLRTRLQLTSLWFHHRRKSNAVMLIGCQRIFSAASSLSFAVCSCLASPSHLLLTCSASSPLHPSHHVLRVPQYIYVNLDQMLMQTWAELPRWEQHLVGITLSRAVFYSRSLRQSRPGLLAPWYHGCC